MADIVMQMKQRNKANTEYDDVFPKTKAELVLFDDGSNLLNTVTSVTKTVNIGTVWVGSSVPYSQTFNDADLKFNSIIDISLSPSATQTEVEAWDNLGLKAAGQTDGSFVLNCWGNKNTVPIPIVYMITVLKMPLLDGGASSIPESINDAINTVDNKIDAHISDGTTHITILERTNWNNALTTLSNLSSEVDTNKTQLDNLATTVTTNKGLFDTLHSEVDTNKTQLDNLSTTVSGNETNITTLTNRLNSIDTDIDNIVSSLNDDIGDLATLSGNVSGLSTSIINMKNIKTATILTSWVGSVAPFSQDISITGVLSTDKPIIDIVMSGDYVNDKLIEEEWNKIYRIVTGSNKITVYADEKTTLVIPIQLKGVY